MSVIIGHASADERGRASGGQAGDQTGREVCTRSWYIGGWNVVLRAKDPAIAEKMARFCEAVCANDCIGYDQYNRNSLRAAARAVGWDASKITAPCSTDCSALMTCCAEAAGVNVPYTIIGTVENAPVTQNMRTRFFNTGAFQVLFDREYLDTSANLRRGDILVRESGHTAMALTDGKNVEDNMTGKEIVSKLSDAEAWELVQKANRYAATLPLPTSWDAQGAWDKATAAGITDGTRPMALATRLEAAVQSSRAEDDALQRVLAEK